MELKEDPAGCPQCDGRVFYKKSTYFGKKVYYKVCNKCGWYRTYPRDEWYQICFGVIEDSGPEKVETPDADLTLNKEVDATDELSAPSDKEISNDGQDSGSTEEGSDTEFVVKETAFLYEKTPSEEEIQPQQKPEAEEKPKRGRKRGRKPKKKKENEASPDRDGETS